MILICAPIWATSNSVIHCAAQANTMAQNIGQATAREVVLHLRSAGNSGYRANVKTRIPSCSVSLIRQRWYNALGGIGFFGLDLRTLSRRRFGKMFLTRILHRTPRTDALLLAHDSFRRGYCLGIVVGRCLNRFSGLLFRRNRD